MNITTIIILIILFVIGLALFLDRKKLKNKPKSNSSKYLDLISTLLIVDEILDEKVSLGQAGVTLDFGYIDQQMKVLGLVSSGKLQLFDKNFTEDLMEIVNDAEFSLIQVENASKFVKNELLKLKKLV